MTVYVDDSGIPAAVTNHATGRTHRSRWSHLMADTEEELHIFAKRLGLRREWYQEPKNLDGSKSDRWHYDVTAPKRLRAIQLGAKQITWRESVEILRARRTAGTSCET